MKIVSDLHLHSKFSRAVSPNMNLQTMATYASQKGIDLLSTGDWTHPVWFKEVQNALEEISPGIYQLKSGQVKNANSSAKFLLSTEISLIYKQGEKVRRVHNLVFVPNIVTAEKVNQALTKRGANLNADGRPIIGMSCHDLLELILNIDERCMLIPCHIWTPHFGVYGSASGFDSLEDAFGDLARFVYGIETGISSDPEMNWVVPELDNRSILSFSDAHSAPKMGRELTVFVPTQDVVRNFCYEDIREAIKRNREGKLKVGYTVEFYPEEGKYHYSGHRNCKVSFGPQEIKKNGSICPVCHQRLTEGVLYRVMQITNKTDLAIGECNLNEAGLVWFTDPVKKHPPFIKLVPLLEIVAQSLHSSVGSQKSQNLYNKLCQELKSEFNVLISADISKILGVGGEQIAQAVDKVRHGKLSIKPGYDGEYGKVKVWEDKQDENEYSPQLSFNF